MSCDWFLIHSERVIPPTSCDLLIARAGIKTRGQRKRRGDVADSDQELDQEWSIGDRERKVFVKRYRAQIA